MANIILWHGARRWQGPPKLQPAGKGRVEYGSGLYLTTSPDTARKYAKRSGTILRFEIDSNATFVAVPIPIASMLKWIDQFRPRNRDKIVSDLHRYSARTGRDEIPTDVLENLMVNWQAIKGPLGPALAQFFVSHGVDGSVTHHWQDDWMVLYNLDKIVSYRKADSKELIDLPRLRHLSSL